MPAGRPVLSTGAMTAQQVALPRAPWMDRLRPRADRPVRAPSASPAVLTQAYADLGVGPVHWAVETASVLLAELRRSAGHRAGGPACSSGIETELLSLLLQLRDRRAVSDLQVTQASLDDARRLAREGAPAVALTEAVWRLHVHVQESMLSATTSLDDGNGSADGRVWDDLLLLTRYSELAANVLLSAYEDARSRSGEWSVRRQETIERLVAGEPVAAADEDLLGVRLGGHHLVAIATDPAGGGALDTDDARIVSFTAAVTDLLQGCSLISASLASETFLCWSRPRPITAADVAAVGRLVVPRGLTIAIGDPHLGPAGVAQGYVEARRAATVASMSERRQPWLHGDVLLTAALLADPGAASQLVSRELAGVMGRDQRSADLRRTVLMFLRSGGSRQSVAQELGVAPTTVAYRIERFERLRGRRVHESRLETWASLAVVDLAPSLLDGLSDSEG